MMYPYKQLIRTALIVAPLMVLINTYPLLINEKRMFSDQVPVMLIALLGMLFYWTIHILLIRLFEKKPSMILRYLLGLCFVLLLTFVVTKLVNMSSLIGSKPSDVTHHYKRSLTISIYVTALFNNILILFILEMAISKNREKMALNENTELKIKNLEAQQLQLRQQIQPHFLFNSLNTLKSLISNYPIEAENYLVKLSSFLRYNLSLNEQDLILLKEELKICSDYLEIQKVRFKDALQYSIQIQEQHSTRYKVPVFAIQLLIENSIKHNRLTAESPLHIRITLTGKQEVSVCNNLQTKHYSEESTRIGLKNLSERYKLLLKKDIQIIETPTKFEVLLPLAS